MSENNCQCVICQRVSSSQLYCKYHHMALEKLKEEYPKWKRAYTEMSWERYLESASKLEGTGLWAIEVAQNEIRRKLALKTKMSSQPREYN